MKTIVSVACAAIMASVSIGATIAPAVAAPTHTQNHPTFYRNGNNAYYNGYLGYPHYRRGWRYYEGYWFPPAAFVFGAIIGGVLLHEFLSHIR